MRGDIVNSTEALEGDRFAVQPHGTPVVVQMILHPTGKSAVETYEVICVAEGPGSAKIGGAANDG
jgi:hypothetical protein